MSLVLQSFARIDDAAAALADPGARYLGGGTLVVRATNEGEVAILRLVRSTDRSLSAIEVTGGKVRIGSSVTMATIACHPQLQPIAAAAKAVGGPAIRNMATVGGNLFAPSPYGDFAVALLALDATILRHRAEVPIERFLADREAGAGIVTAVAFDLPPPDRFRFLKVARVKPKGVSVVSIAALLEQAADGTITAARIALGCMADRPVRARAAESALVGRPLTAEGIAPALAVATKGTTPVTDAIASAWYRAQVLSVHLGRLLLS